MGGHALVIGGSLGGMFAAHLLSQSGWRVDVFERSAEDLAGRGAGLGTHQALIDVMRRIGIDREIALGVDTSRYILLDARGRIACQLDYPRVMTAWARLYRPLKDAFPARHYHPAKSFVAAEQDAHGITAIFADGSPVFDPQEGFKGTVLARYAETGSPLLSGYLIGEKYLQDTQVLRTGKPRFIDKMPNNFRHVGLLHLMLPNARIIDARREPMACCFSNFKQLFASGQEFTYSLEDIGRYYRSYVKLMDHWDRVLPGKVLRIQHESVVADLEGNVRRLLEFCGLEFESACLEFWKTRRHVRTASSEQVRRPIFTDGLGQWRNFEPWLGPLKDILS